MGDYCFLTQKGPEGLSSGSFFRSQVDAFEVTAGGAAADGGKQDEQQRPRRQDDKLHPVAAGLGVHARHTGEVMERFRGGDGEKPDDAVADERPAEPTRLLSNSYAVFCLKKKK